MTQRLMPGKLDLGLANLKYPEIFFYYYYVVAMIFLPFWYCFVLCYDFNTFWAFLVVIKGLSRNIDLRKYNILTKLFAIEFVLQLEMIVVNPIFTKYTVGGGCLTPPPSKHSKSL